jgi:hypothetical protein
VVDRWVQCDHILLIHPCPETLCLRARASEMWRRTPLPLVSVTCWWNWPNISPKDLTRAAGRGAFGRPSWNAVPTWLHPGTLHYCCPWVFGWKLCQQRGWTWRLNILSPSLDCIGFLSVGVYAKPGVRDSSGDTTWPCGNICSSNWNQPGNAGNLSKRSA